MESLENTAIATHEGEKKNETDKQLFEELYNQIKDNPELYDKIKNEVDKELSEKISKMIENTELQECEQVDESGNEDGEPTASPNGSVASPATTESGDSENKPTPSTKENVDDETGRKHRRYKPRINHTALKDMEGTTAISFVELAQSVIMIDNKPYEKKDIPLSKERKRDFRRLIEHYAVLEVIGKRKYHVKRVYSKKQREELNELEIFPPTDKPKR